MNVMSLWPAMTMLLAVTAADEPGYFAERVAPVLERKCVQCHNDSVRRGGLSLQSAPALSAGSDSGQAVVPGDVENSFLLDYVSGDPPEMPKNGPPLTADEIASLRQWIEAGAKFPGEVTLRDRSEVDTNWWSLQPLRKPAIPAVQPADAAWAQNPIDAFILAKQRELGIGPSPPADRRTLIRRLSFDLIGLPPTPDEVRAFESDEDPKAYEKLVDRLLESPHYGERWARHWLDIVHYGDTHGYDKDKLRPNAWPYRDYVIRAFNEDKPYSRFVQEQLAGDVLWPETLDGQVATGFIAAGPWDFIGHAEVPESKLDGKVARHLDRDDMVMTTMNSFMSITVQCAQCHNHKFDPVSQEQYYSLQAVFAALDRADKPFEADPEVGRQRQQLLARQRQLTTERDPLQARMTELGGEPLQVLDRQLAELTKQKQSKEERPEYGYHSQIASQPDQIKWVQVDLGTSRPIRKIVYVGCWDAFNQIFHGFGFPVRYRIEVSDDPEFQTAVTVLDRTAEDQPNPGTQPQSVVLDQTARYVRVTATKLAPRLNDFIFALGELQVFGEGGVNVAFNQAVTSLDSIEAPVRWGRKNLVDGYFYGVRSNASTEEAIERLTAERQKLLELRVPPAEQHRLGEIQTSLRRVEKSLAELPPPGMVFCGCVHSGKGNFVGTGGQGGRPREIRILERGNVSQPTDPVQPGALAIVRGVDWRFSLPAEHQEGDRRIALARWITLYENPLTWRSIVNRVWQYHFGRGLVDSPNDFGRMGQQPTHPELLDWLAVEFRDGRQSLKDLHRSMVTSATYRQSSTGAGIAKGEGSTAPQSIDADNRFLWRMNRRKLEAEAVRDAVLMSAGKLDRSLYGPAFQDFVIEKPEHSPHYEYSKYDPDDPRTHRRSIYRFLVRSQPQPFMNTLDCADPSQLVDKRNETLTALQALTLLNNRFMVRMSEHFATRLQRDTPDTVAQIEMAFRLALSRSPEQDERDDAITFINRYGLANFCRVVFNLNEFAFVD